MSRESQKMITLSTLPPLEGVEGGVEELLLLVHLGADWDVWGTRHDRYWDAFKERILSAAFMSRNGREWWEKICQLLPSEPQSHIQRKRTIELLNQWGENDEFIPTLRQHSGELTTRIRIHLDEWRENQQGDNDE